MRLNKKIIKSLSDIFSNLAAEITLLLSSITSEEQLDATVEWLRGHYPKQAPSSYCVVCLKQAIHKWGNILEKQFSDDFKNKFPLVAGKLEGSAGNMLIFLRAIDLCHITLEFLAEIVEPIIKAHEVERKQVYTVKAESTSSICMIASSPQPYVRVFLDVFLPNLNKSGEKAGEVYFDWRSVEEQKENLV